MLVLAAVPRLIDPYTLLSAYRVPRLAYAHMCTHEHAPYWDATCATEMQDLSQSLWFFASASTDCQYHKCIAFDDYHAAGASDAHDDAAASAISSRRKARQRESMLQSTLQYAADYVNFSAVEVILRCG